MKRLFIYAMAMLMLVSCRLDNGTGTHRTPAAVENYTSGLMYSVVVNSTEFLDEAIVLDTYLKLSEEERQDARYDYLRDNLKQYDENTYVYENYKVFSTGGVSLTEPGSTWTVKISVENLSDYMYRNYYLGLLYAGAGDGQSGQEDNGAVTWTLTCTDTDCWNMSVGSASSVMMEAGFVGTKAELSEGYDYRGSGYDYTADVSGVIAEDDNGYSGVFKADDFHYFYEEYEGSYWDGFEEYAGGYYRDFTVTLRLDIYHGGALRDWCVQYTTSSGTDFLTSVDSSLPL